MPLRDHFDTPDSIKFVFPSVQAAWATNLTFQLNKTTLPERYYALLRVAFEARKAEGPGSDIPYGSFPDGEDVGEIWTPPSSSLTVQADLTNLDIAEVSVHRAKDRSLAAVIALVTPGNKNTPRRRTAFLSRMVTYLQQEAGVLVVDVVRKPRENLHAALMQFLDAGTAVSGVLTSDLYSAAYRTAGKFQSARLEIWPAPLAIGEALPVLPLWLEEYLAVPVDLEAAYVSACLGNRLL